MCDPDDILFNQYRQRGIQVMKMMKTYEQQLQGLMKQKLKLEEEDFQIKSAKRMLKSLEVIHRNIRD